MASGSATNRMAENGSRTPIGRRLMEPSSLTALAAIVVGALYALGIILTNLCLASFGIHDFSGLKVQLAITGLLFVAYCVLPAIPPIATILASRAMRTLVPAVRVAMAVVVLCVTLYLVTLTLGAILDHESFLGRERTPWPGLLYHWRIYLRGGDGSCDPRALLWLCLLYGGIALSAHARFRTEARAARSLGILLLGYGIYASAAHYAYDEHRHLKAAFGGGSYGTIDLSIKTSAAEPLRKLCLPISPDLTIERAPLLYETSTAYFILCPVYAYGRCFRDTFRIEKPGVVATRWDPWSDLEKWPWWFTGSSVCGRDEASARTP